MRYTAREIAAWSAQHERGGRWLPARPVNRLLESWRDRLPHAWGVLAGRYDALDWED